MMKRLILSVVVLLLTTMAVKAARALSIPFEVTQPDGTVLTIVLNGDEHVSWLSTTDGVMLVAADKTYYVAAINDDGSLRATKQLAHNASLRAVSEKEVCLQQQARQALFYDRADEQLQAARRAQINPTGGYCLHEGSPRVLVILAGFSDLGFVTENTQETFNQLCNAEKLPQYSTNASYNNLCSVRRYFEQSSHGKFSPQMDVVGPITLPQTMAYYGGSAEESSTDANFDQFCKDAIAAVDDDVDFNLYDNDGDGNAELVCVIYAGYGQNISGNHKDTIWPKCSRKNVTTSDAYAKDESKKVVVSYMNCGAELFHVSKGNEINGFGTFIHEFSHGLGLADHYATVSKARIDDQTPEYWDLMDYGEHAGNGYAPVPYSVWEQEVMGWTTVEVLSETQNVSGMKPLVQGGKAYKFGNGANQEEWMYLENVQPRDKENQVPGFMYGHGLLVWHVAYASSKVTMYDYPNNTAGTPRVCIVPADGLVINGYRFVSKGDPTPSQPYTKEQYQTSLRLDTFSGSSEVTTLNASMELPNFKFYNGDATPIQSLTSIVEDEQSKEISFTFNDGGATAISEMRNTELGIKNAEFYNLNGQRVTKPTKRGIYIQNGKKIMVR